MYFIRALLLLCTICATLHLVSSYKPVQSGVLRRSTTVNIPSIRSSSRWGTSLLKHHPSLKLQASSTHANIIEKDGVYSVEFEAAGQKMSFETGKIGRQADGAVVARIADTMVYSTVCYQKDATPVDFTPLRVDYFARFSSIGQTVGSFTKRDSRGDDNEILVARLIDRPIRPVIQDGWQHDTQILSWVLSYDKQHSPEPLAICAASAALAISDIPLIRPIAGVEVGFINGSFVVNPTKDMMKESELSLTIAGTKQGILMIEGSAQFLSEQQMMEAIQVGHRAIGEICDAIDLLAKHVGKTKKVDTLRKLPASLLQEMDELFGSAIYRALSIGDKHQRGKAVAQVEEEIEQRFVKDTDPNSSSSSIILTPSIEDGHLRGTDDMPVSDLDSETATSSSSAGASAASASSTATSPSSSSSSSSVDVPPTSVADEDEASEVTLKSIGKYAKKATSATASSSFGYGYNALDVKIAIKKLLVRKLRALVLETGRRSDGRGVEDIRPISIESSWLPGAHGSALFTRGETQSISTATLGGKSMEAAGETLDGMQHRRFYLQYRFPPSSVGEVGRVGGGLSRREVGHGNLAERALLPVIPAMSEFPYAIRGESLITESSGSSSMASVCGVCLAMLDAGVPLQRSVAGVAMGLILPDEEEEETAGNRKLQEHNARKPVILTDILGLEDALGTMDFKVAGDEEGITAFQLDIKCEGLTLSILQEALEQAKRGRLHILESMKAHLATPRPLNDHIPKIVFLSVPPDSLGKIIGPKGKTVQGLIATHQVDDIHLEDDGSIQILGKNMTNVQAAYAAITQIVEEFQQQSEKKPMSGGGSGGGGGGGRRQQQRTSTNTTATGMGDGESAEASEPVVVGPPPEVGTIYRNCPIVGVHTFGVFVEITPGHEGLVHISELDLKRIRDINEAGFVEGKMIDVQYLGDNDRGKMRLSRRTVLLRDSGVEL